MNFDELQEHEAKQQRLVEEILRSLHDKTRDNGEYRAFFHRLAIAALTTLQYPEPRQTGMQTDLEKFVWRPIEAFTHDAAERRLLLLKVLEKLMESVRSSVIGDYNRQEYEKRYARTRHTGTSPDGEGTEFPSI